MATTIEAAFNELLANIRSSPTETAAAASHRESIRAKLQDAFGMTAFFRSGSFGNGTHVAGLSDVDYFAVIPRANLRQNSSETLAAIAQALRERFPRTEGIRVNGPAVQVPFGLDGAEMTEIVPVDYIGQTGLNFRQFDMPDGNGGWMFSAPESHNAYVSGADDKHDGRVKPLIRFLKTWKYLRNVPVKSFYLEIWTAAYAWNESSIVWDMDIARVLEGMLFQGFLDGADPRFKGKIIRASNTEAQREDAKSKLGRAAAWARHAVQYNLLDDPAAAFERWNLVFNDAFPDYRPR